MTHHPAEVSLPNVRELGRDLLQVTALRRITTLSSPFIAMMAYVLFAYLRWWPLAVVSVMALSFVSYGSTSHDLVHRTLKLPRRQNDCLLSLIELCSFRSGTAYRLSHLHHHRRLLEHDDIEGRPAFGSLLGAILAGPGMQFRSWRWAWINHPDLRRPLLLEAVGILLLIIGCIAAWPWTPAPLIYAILAIAGSWVFPLVTVYLPHDAAGTTPLTKTRLFRGWVVRIIAADHLYHIEHHLYPAVPHHHWKILAKRLDPYFEKAGITYFGSDSRRD